jgi:hypothetical protein
MDEWFIEKFNIIMFKNWVNHLSKVDLKSIVKKITRINLLLSQDNPPMKKIRSCSIDLMNEIHELSFRLNQVVEKISSENDLETNHNHNSSTILGAIIRDVEKSLRSRKNEGMKYEK